MVSLRTLSLAATLALLVLLAVLCAHWFWIFAAPPASAPPAQVGTELFRPLDSIRRAQLFGATAMPLSATPKVRTDLALRGVSAARSGGIAVIALDRARTVTVRAGDEVAPGIRLERVGADHAIVVQNGVAQRIDLPQRKPVDAGPVAQTYAPAKQ